MAIINRTARVGQLPHHLRSKAASRQAKISHWTPGDTAHEKFIVLPFSSCDKTDVKPESPSHEILLLAFRKWTWKYPGTHSQADSAFSFRRALWVKHGSRLRSRVPHILATVSLSAKDHPIACARSTHGWQGYGRCRGNVDCVENRLVIIHETSGNKHSLSRNCFQLL